MATWGDYSLRTLIKKVVGATWDGTSISDLLSARPKFEIVTQPTDTTGNSIPIAINSTGFFYRLQQKDGDTWSNVGADRTAAFYNANVNLSGVIETKLCRVVIWPYGANVNITSNEFTVTRTSAQTQALKQNLASGKLDTEVAGTDVVEPTIDKMETEPVVEKTTTTKSK